MPPKKAAKAVKPAKRPAAATTKKPARQAQPAKRTAAPRKAAAPASAAKKPAKAAKKPAPAAAKRAAPAAVKQPAPTPAPVPPRPKKVLAPNIAAKTLEKLKIRLAEERETYMRQADELAAEAEALMADREPGDTQFDEESGEGDTINVERERDLALSASARQAVEEIDEALARMKAGTYGLCQRCGNRIPVARLEAVPQAALCIECKSRQERRR